MALPGTHGNSRAAQQGGIHSSLYDLAPVFLPAEWQDFCRPGLEGVTKLSVSSWFLALAELPALGEHSCFSEHCFPLFIDPFLDIYMQSTEVKIAVLLGQKWRMWQLCVKQPHVYVISGDLYYLTKRSRQPL